MPRYVVMFRAFQADEGRQIVLDVGGTSDAFALVRVLLNNGMEHVRIDEVPGPKILATHDDHAAVGSVYPVLTTV